MSLYGTISVTLINTSFLYSTPVSYVSPCLPLIAFSFTQYSTCSSMIGITSSCTLGRISPSSKYVGRITNFRNPIWLSGLFTVFRSHNGEIGNPNSFSASPFERNYRRKRELDYNTRANIHKKRHITTPTLCKELLEGHICPIPSQF